MTKYLPHVLTTALLTISSDSNAQQQLRPLWELGAGVAAISFPDYRGSDQQRAYALPIPYFVYRGTVLQVDREEVRGVLFSGERFDLDVSANASVPVRSDDNRARHGMPDIDPTLELGPQLNFMLAENRDYSLTFHLPLRTVLAYSGGFYNTGWLTTPNLNLDIRDTGPGGGWNLGLSGGPLWGDKRYHDYFYGVDPADATAERPAYSAEGGYSGAQFTLSLSKRYDRTWVGAFLRLSDVTHAAFESSPLVRQRTNYMAGIGISRVFSQAQQSVPSDD